MEAAVRWLPHHNGDGRRQFLLVDVMKGSLTLNCVEQIDKRGLSYKSIAKADKLPNFGAFDYSKTDDSVIAVGLVSGSANLIRFYPEEGNAENIANFKVRQQRKCNSIAINDRNWLAVALDKTRSDVCLNIYDTGSNTSQEPIRRLCAAEVVSSVRFFPSQPQEIVAAAQKALIRIYDLRDGYNTSASLQAATKNVNNIAIDPMDENYFASAGSTDDPCVTVWDRRWLTGLSTVGSVASSGGSNTGAVFDFRPAVNNSIKTTVWSLRYCGFRRGRLGLCSSAGELKIIDMAESSSFLTQGSTEYSPTNPFGGSNWTCNRYVQQTRSVEKPWHDAAYRKEQKDRVIAFDWLPKDDLQDQAILTLRPNREVGLIRVPTSRTHASVTGRFDLCINTLDKLMIAEPRARMVNNAIPSKRYQRTTSVTAEEFGPLDYQGEADHVTEDGALVGLEPNSPALASILAGSTTYQDRCRKGYLFDCQRNMEIVASNWYLERLWEIVGRFKEQAGNDKMVYKSLDLSFVGVSGLWSQKLTMNSRRKLALSHASISDAIIGLNSANNLPPFEGQRTDYSDHRQLCLMVCGWKFTPDELEAECQELIDRGLYYQAIVQAVLHDQKHVALNFLRTLIRSKVIPNTGINALLAADQINEEQRRMCEWMAADTEDPSLKALLTFLISGDWRDVMKTTYLHLGYRVALGMKYLNDTELGGFIQSETARAVKNGDLEGILLTGLTEQAMDLLQTYLSKTNDLQTVVLVSAFTNPLYVDDVRWDMWKETYFMQMQTWRCFVQRSKFTVQHNRMATTRDGRSLIESPGKQIQIRCVHCNANVNRHDSRFLNGHPSTNSDASESRIVGPAAAAGTVCLTCGRHMPRCAICLRWLGTPDPRKAGGEKELEQLGNLMAKFLTFCVDCGHGFHADHAQSWFKKHSVCPVPDCECLCGLG